MMASAAQAAQVDDLLEKLADRRGKGVTTKKGVASYFQSSDVVPWYYM